MLFRSKAKRAIEDATEPDAEDDSERPAPIAAEDVRLEKPSAEEQAAADKSAASKPAAKPTSKSSAQSTANKAAKGFGMQLGRMGKMFSDFKDEFDKASK